MLSPFRKLRDWLRIIGLGIWLYPGSLPYIPFQMMKYHRELNPNTQIPFPLELLEYSHPWIITSDSNFQIQDYGGFIRIWNSCPGLKLNLPQPIPKPEFRVVGRSLSIEYGSKQLRIFKIRSGFMLQIPLEWDEHLYGLGERFSSFDLRGHSYTCWITDAMSNSSSRSYICIPFLVSCKGYGLLLNSYAKMKFDAKGDDLKIYHYDRELDLIFFKGSIHQILRNYTRLTGRPPLIPKWGLGLWISRCMYPNRSTVESIASKFRELDLPGDVINLDPLWLKNRRKWPKDACDFIWSHSRFPDPEDFISRLSKLGFKLCLWINPYLPRYSPVTKSLIKQHPEYFPRRKSKLAKCWDNPHAYPLDFTHPQAVEWFKSKLRELLHLGVAVFKTDYGEGAPEDADYLNAPRSGIHNLYPLLYNQAVFQQINQSKGYGLVWARSGSLGSHVYPIHWSGDPRSSFSELKHVLMGGLNLALSGFGHWSNDIGGFWGSPSKELYIRWAQFGLLCPESRLHGVGPREPWEFGEDALKIFRKYSKLRYRLIPYLYSYAWICSRTGIPIMRPMVLEYQSDQNTHGLYSQYLLGREMLIAPVLEKSKIKSVYLPKGEWIHFWDGDLYWGPKWIKLEAPLDIMPIFIKQDSIIPMAPESNHLEDSPWDFLELEIYVSRYGFFPLYDGEFIPIQAWRDDLEASLRISGSNKRFRARFHGVPAPERLEILRGELLEWRHVDRILEVEFQAEFGAHIQIKFQAEHG